MGLINRDKTITLLLDLTLSINEDKFKRCIINLIQKLSLVPIAEDINEPELCTRFFDPFFFSGLFDDPDEGTYLWWANEITLEAQLNEDLTTKRPDLCIGRLHGMAWASNHRYGKAKSASQGNNNYLVCQYLLRSGVFCKNSLDINNMESVLGLQVIGRMVTFYILVLPSTGLYVMYGLEKIKIPSCLDDLTAYKKESKVGFKNLRTKRSATQKERYCYRSVFTCISILALTKKLLNINSMPMR